MSNSNHGSSRTRWARTQGIDLSAQRSPRQNSYLHERVSANSPRAQSRGPRDSTYTDENRNNNHDNRSGHDNHDDHGDHDRNPSNNSYTFSSNEKKASQGHFGPEIFENRHHRSDEIKNAFELTSALGRYPNPADRPESSSGNFNHSVSLQSTTSPSYNSQYSTQDLRSMNRFGKATLREQTLGAVSDAPVYSTMSPYPQSQSITSQVQPFAPVSLAFSSTDPFSIQSQTQPQPQSQAQFSPPTTAVPSENVTWMTHKRQKGPNAVIVSWCVIGLLGLAFLFCFISFFGPWSGAVREERGASGIVSWNYRWEHKYHLARYVSDSGEVAQSYHSAEGWRGNIYSNASATIVLNVFALFCALVATVLVYLGEIKEKERLSLFGLVTIGVGIIFTFFSLGIWLLGCHYAIKDAAASSFTTPVSSLESSVTVRWGWGLALLCFIILLMSAGLHCWNYLREREVVVMAKYASDTLVVQSLPSQIEMASSSGIVSGNGSSGTESGNTSKKSLFELSQEQPMSTTVATTTSGNNAVYHQNIMVANPSSPMSTLSSIQHSQQPTVFHDSYPATTPTASTASTTSTKYM